MSCRPGISAPDLKSDGSQDNASDGASHVIRNQSPLEFAARFNAGRAVKFNLEVKQISKPTAAIGFVSNAPTGERAAPNVIF